MLCGMILNMNSFLKSQDKATGGLNPEPCPICARPLGQEVSVDGTFQTSHEWYLSERLCNDPAYD